MEVEQQVAELCAMTAPIQNSVYIVGGAKQKPMPKQKMTIEEAARIVAQFSDRRAKR